MLQSDLEFSGRSVSLADLDLIRELNRDFSNLRLTDLSKTVCELLEWKHPTRKLKHEQCRAFLEHLPDPAVLTLQGLRPTAAPGPRRIGTLTQSEVQAPVA